MSDTFNVYCDESCHLENDHQKVMVLGAVWCPFDKTRETGRYYGKENQYPELSDVKLDNNGIWSEVKIDEGGK